MQQIKEQIKKQINESLKYMRMETSENQVYVAKTINELLDAYHKTERKQYKKKFKYADTDSLKRKGKHIPRID